MNGSAPKEIPGISPQNEAGKIIHLPTQDARWRGRVASNVRKVVVNNPFTAEHATPTAETSIPMSQHLKDAGVELAGTGSDLPSISFEDAKHHIETLGAPVFGEEPETYNRRVSGPKSAIKWKERALKLLGKVA